MANMPFTLEEEVGYINNGLITCRKHPNFDLWILNYTQKCVVDRKWDDITTSCRGLIYDGRRRIVARPFRKFFNLEELKEGVPNDRFQVLDKADGSLGIAYTGPDGQVYIATRGSFESEQAIRGTDFWRRQYPGAVITNGITLLFEIVYRENKYVVDYGDFEGLILIAALENENGGTFDLGEDMFDRYIKIEQYEGLRTVEEVKKFVESPDRANTEGVVLYYPHQDLRVKIKSSRYLEVFGIISGWNERNVWESLSAGSKSATELLDDKSLPEEFQIWLQKTVGDFRLRFDEIWLAAEQWFEFRPQTDSRKRLAEYFQKFKYPAVLFAMLDGKQSKAEQIVWQILKP